MQILNNILIIERSDLTYLGKSKEIKDIEYTDIANSLEDFKKAGLVLFVDNETHIVKILKSRY